MNRELVKQIADAVLYEGYILYPYRASAVKNQQRFNFGLLVPPPLSQEQGGSDPCAMSTQCLIEGDQPVIDVQVRFLQLVSREVFASDAESDGRPLQSLAVGGTVYHTWQEAVDRELTAENLCVDHLAAKPHEIEFAFEPSTTSEALTDDNGHNAGKLVRRQTLLQGSVSIRAESERPGLSLISVEIQNTTRIECLSAREDVLMHSCASTHTILAARRGQFLSLTDPPEALAEVAAKCRNIGTWPVLAGKEGDRDTMLSSPIILYDYPQVAAESGGDFFDSTEIDEMLALRVMTLTDEEKLEMRQVDQRARQILERTESLPPEHWHKLHGTIRGLKTVES